MHCHIAWGSGQWNSCNAPPHCLEVVGSAIPAIHCHTVWGWWVVGLLQCTATLVKGQWAVELLQWGTGDGEAVAA